MLKHLFAALLCLLPALGFAQDKSRAILVLDASGSMWGQIDGKAKITIAQDVIGDLLQSLPAEQELGLTVYGHRRKGDCSDIETLILPGGDTRNAIMMAVSAIKPKGKTPLSAAVIQAAEALKYTEEKATVILVSDGRETCDLDPCAVGRKLEEAGIDFTAHVIGFDISNAKDRAELQCLAEETGGTFRTASNADELGEALQVIAEPEPVKVTFRAVEGQNGPVIETQLIWFLTYDDKTLIDTAPHANNFTMDLLAGSGHVEVLRPEDELTVDADFTVSEDSMTVTLVLPKSLPLATFSGPDQVAVGETFNVVWDGPNKQVSGGGDYIAISKTGSSASSEITYAYTKDSENNTAELVAPIHPGTYELRYILNENDNTVLAKRELIVTPVTATVDFTGPATAGGTLDVAWVGPNRQVSGGGDYISLSKPGSKDNEEITYAYTKDSENNVATLTVPTTPGTYEIRYILNGTDNIILASKDLLVEPVSATLSFTSPAAAGDKLDVTWTGPGGKDYITIARPDMRVDEEISYDYVSNYDVNTVTLNVPTTPGTYEVRYIQRGTKKKILATVELVVEPVKATLEFASPAPAGGKLNVTWSGPGGEDYIAIAQSGMKVNDEVTYAYISNSDGNTVEINIPTTPGTYELRYIQKGTEKKILASVELVVEPVKATLEFASPAPAGSKLNVTWSGPGGEDYIAIAQPGMKLSDEVTYAYVSNSDGNTVAIKVPTTPGTYELRYVQKGNEKKMLAAVELVVEPVKASLEFASPAPAGGKLTVTWDGPGGEDYIAIARPSMDLNDEETYAYVSNSDGNTIEINIPAAPGTYEMRYVQKGNEKKMLAAVPLDVVPMRASLQASDTTPRGEKMDVVWSGPSHRRDTIIIAKPGSDSAEAFASVAAGSPAALYAPMVTGDYEIRYIYGPLNKVLATIPLKVE